MIRSKSMPISALFSTSSNLFLSYFFPTFLFSLVLLLFILPLPAISSSLTSTHHQHPTYKPNDPIQLTCLARNLETGEHILLEDGKSLKYVPFPTCAETGKPFFVNFLEETDNKTCTIASVDDELFHLLEFYVHNDSPLSCRVRERPEGFVEEDHHDENKHGKKKKNSDDDNDENENNLLTDYNSNPYIPLTINLVGKIEKSHIHISPVLNMIFHLDGPEEEPGLHSAFSSSSSSFLKSSGSINSATAYSINYASSTSSRSPMTKLTIGSPLTLSFSIRWFPYPSLPKASQIRYTTVSSLESHIALHTVLYCLITCIGTAAVCVVYFRWEMPRRLRKFDFDSLGGGANGTGVYSGNGYGAGYGHGYGGYGYGFGGKGNTSDSGKKD